MANTTISPNMNMPVPVVTVDPGPDWATNINSCLSIIDGHNHTPGSGVPITPSAININSDLSFNGNNAISLRSVRFSAQGSPLSGAADLGCLYESGLDLFYNDGAGNQVRITQSGSVAGSSGTITGLPSGTASASFSGTTFTFESATSTPASIDGGPLRIAQAVANGLGVTISASSSQTGNYDLTLPIALPAAQSLLASDSSGNLSFLYNGANIRSPEGAGTTTLISSDNFNQTFNLTAPRTVILPSSGITAGQIITIQNAGNGALTVESSNTNMVAVVDSLYSSLKIMALIDSPAAKADWVPNLNYSQLIYSAGTNYNGGLSPTITGTNWTTTFGRFIPYQLHDGNWWLRFSINGNFTGSANSVSIAVNGISFLSNEYQTCSFYPDLGGGNAQIWNGGVCGAGNGSIAAICSTTPSIAHKWGFTGDVMLDSKPTWAF